MVCRADIERYAVDLLPYDVIDASYLRALPITLLTLRPDE